MGTVYRAFDGMPRRDAGYVYRRMSSLRPSWWAALSPHTPLSMAGESVGACAGEVGRARGDAAAVEDRVAPLGDPVLVNLERRDGPVGAFRVGATAPRSYSNASCRVVK